MIRGPRTPDTRRALLVGALGFCCSEVREAAPETPLAALRSWLSTGATGSAFEATPSRAVQVAAWKTLAGT